MVSHGLFKKKEQQCPQCGQPLQVRRNKKGYFLRCQAYPDCHYQQATQQPEKGVIKELAGTHCPLCQDKLVMRQGQYGLFVSCIHYPECQYYTAIDKSQAIQINCPACQKGELTERLSRYGKYFYGCSRYPDCRFTLADKPVVGRCQQCDYPLLIEKKSHQQWQRICPHCQKVQNES